MKISITIDESELKRLVIKELDCKLGSIPLDESKVKIMVKSKQNYKSEWEVASFKAEYDADS